jgi:hypothetical protein
VETDSSPELGPADTQTAALALAMALRERELYLAELTVFLFAPERNPIDAWALVSLLREQITDGTLAGALDDAREYIRPEPTDPPTQAGAR